MTVANGTAAILGALTIVFTVRVLSVPDWATAAIIVSIGPLISATVSLGTVTYHVRQISVLPHDGSRAEAFETFIGRRFAVAAVVAVLGLAFACAGSAMAGWCLLLASARFFQGATIVRLSADRRFGGQSLVMIVEKLVTLAILAVTLRAFPSPYSLPLAQLVAAMIAGGGALIITSRTYDHRRVLKGFLTPQKMWSGSRYFGITSLSSAFQKADVSIVAALAGSYQAGLFAAAARIPSTLNVLGGALAIVIMPTASQANGRTLPLTRRHKWSAIGAMTIPCVVIGVGLATASLWVPALLGAEYAAAVPVVQIYLVAVFVSIINQPMVAVLQARSKDKVAAQLVTFQVSAGLLMQAGGAVLAGALGAAIGFLVGAVAVAVLLLRRVYAEFRS